MHAEVATRVVSVATHSGSIEALGVTIVTGMLFGAGALGALCRVVATRTQINWSQRTFVDMLIGGCAGILLPIFTPAINRIFDIKFETWNAVQQAVLAIFLGGSGSYFWTAIGWRTGLIVTPEEAATGVKREPPEAGVLKMTAEADRAAAKYRADPTNAVKRPPSGEEG